MNNIQAGILENPPPLARYLTFNLLPDCDPAEVLQELARQVDGTSTVVGLGHSLLLAMDTDIPEMRHFPALTGRGIDVPSTPAALWCWLRGDDRGELLHRGHDLVELLSDAFELASVIDAFMYRGNRDLSGYEDGTENPLGEDAITAAIVSDQGAGLDGASFVAVQQWIHDLDYFNSLDRDEQDDIFGRHQDDNEEFDEAPDSAHVKRTAQESYEPEAFIVRRSMPWADAQSEGLVFVAFGRSLDAFEMILQRMTGQEDGIIDALFRFTRPVTGNYFWCPPTASGQLDLSALNL